MKRVYQQSSMTVDINTYRCRVGMFVTRPNHNRPRKMYNFHQHVVNNSFTITTYLLLIGLLQIHQTSIQLKISPASPPCKLTLKPSKIKQASALAIVYLPFLLLLSGDIESNPGPITPITSSTELACYFLNARSIKKITDNSHKLREFKELLTIANPDILGVSETWLNSNIADTDIASEEEYIIHRKDRSQQVGGGVLLLVKPSIKSVRRDNLEVTSNQHNEIIVVEIEPSPGNKIAIITAYRSQQDPYALFLSNLETTLHNCTRANLTKLLVIGDFNYSKITWNPRTDTALPPHCREFIQVTSGFGLCQLNKNPSRRTNNNILDLIFTNFPDKLSKIYADTFHYTSDHFLLHFDLITTIEHITHPKRTVYNFKRANIPLLKTDITNSNLTDRIATENSVNNKLNAWATGLKNLINKHVPKITIKREHTAPWIDSEVIKLLRKKDCKLTQAKKHDTPAAWERFKHLRNRLKNLITYKHKEYLTNIFEGVTTNPKRFWSFIKSKSKSRGLPSFLYNSMGEKIDSYTGMSTIFNLFFQSTFTPVTNNPLPPVTIMHDANLQEIKLSEHEVLQELTKLNPAKAQGPDELPTRILKDCSHEITPSITQLFNDSLTHSTVPTAWKQANIVPIHKKGTKHQASNFRPISLLPVISKVLERCIYNRIIIFILPKITNLQHGFLRNRSTATQLLQVFSNITNILDSGDQTDVIYFDLSKAFDSVPHKLLIHKLQSFGICGKLLAWIENYLTNRVQRVSFNGANSDWLPVTSGVPQGSILGPLLFLLYINDLPSALSENTLCAIFADDTKIYRHIVSHQDHLILQHDVNNIFNWSKLWGLTFNKSKCNIISLKKSTGTTEYIYSMDNTNLTRVTTAPDLGIEISNTLKWNAHINQLTIKANRRLWFLVRTLGFNAPFKSKLTTYMALVRSILEYNSTVWNPYTKENILTVERVQRLATDFITNNPRRPSPNRISYKDRLLTCNLLPLSYRREVYDLILFIKSIKGMISFNILDYISFQQDPHIRVTRNRVEGLTLLTPITRLESSAHFYPSRIAHLWNALHIDLRKKLTAPIPISQVKSILNNHYKNKLTNYFDADNACTFVTACRCNICK